jgi:hypothetical protein
MPVTLTACAPATLVDAAATLVDAAATVVDAGMSGLHR